MAMLLYIIRAQNKDPGELPEQMEPEIFSAAAGFAAGFLAAGAVLGFFLLRAREKAARLETRLSHEQVAKDEMSRVFSLTAQEALRDSSAQFLQLAQEKLKQAQNDGAHDLEKRQKAVADMVTPIEKSLKDMQTRIETLGKAGAGLETQLKTFSEDQRLLRQETHNLVQALRNPAARGRWGEMQLSRALEMIGMVEGTHYVQQQSATSEGTRRQPDFIISLPGGARIVIDVKTPVEPYWHALEHAGNEAEKEAALTTFRRNMREHLKQLTAREYWRHFESPQFVVMFLPTEGLYSMAVSGDPALIEDAARSNVILASPTTLMGLLRVVMHGWQQQHMAEEARKVANLASDLYNRIAKFGEHMQKVGRSLGTAIKTYNEAVGSLESSVLPGARKFRDLHVQTGGRDIPGLEGVEEAPRGISAPEFIDNEFLDPEFLDTSGEKIKKSA